MILSPSPATPGGSPVATSTPRSAQPEVESGAGQNGSYEGKGFDEDEAKRLSTSSELTQVSTTDMSSHGDDLENEIIDQVALNKNLKRHATPPKDQSQSIALSDVVLEEASLGHAPRKAGEMAEPSLGLPPPVPSSPPPSLEAEGMLILVIIIVNMPVFFPKTIHRQNGN